MALRQAGFRQQHLADRICYAIRRFQETGSNLDHPRSGRPHVSIRADEAYIRGEWVPAVGRRMSLQTVRNRLELPSANLTLIIFVIVNICIFIHMKHVMTHKSTYIF